MRIPLAAVLFLAVTASSASAQMGLVSGRDTVVLGVLYQRTPEGLEPVSRFGIVVGGKDGGRATVEVPADRAAGGGGYAVDLVARRKGGGVEVAWSLAPRGGTLRAAQGEQHVEPGTMGRLAMVTEGEVQVHASVEAGPASDFPYERVARAFGLAGVTTPQPAAAPVAAPPAPGWAQPVAAATAPAQGWAQPQPVAVAPAPPAASSQGVTLAFSVEQDGKVVFAPQVRVLSGRAFSVAGGEAVSLGGAASGRPYDGLQLAGTATIAGDSAWIDLSVQSGRALAGAGQDSYVVDRYRQGVRVPLGQQVAVDLFDDVAGAGSGRLRLLVTATP